jgi:hypothetical protein
MWRGVQVNVDHPVLYSTLSNNRNHGFDSPKDI